jgi:hypothetical protein
MGTGMDAADTGWRRLGSVLVEAGLVGERDLVEALAEQERSGQRLGAILVARGLVSTAAVANALAEQHGGFLKTEHGFGTGLRALIDKSSVLESDAEPEAPPLSVALDSGASAKKLEADPAGAPDLGHLLFVSTYQGYLLLRRSGSAPALGEELALPETPGARLVVTKVASSPLPRDRRVCAYLNNL